MNISLIAAALKPTSDALLGLMRATKDLVLPKLLSMGARPGAAGPARGARRRRRARPAEGAHAGAAARAGAPMAHGSPNRRAALIAEQEAMIFINLNHYNCRSAGLILDRNPQPRHTINHLADFASYSLNL